VCAAGTNPSGRELRRSHSNSSLAFRGRCVKWASNATPCRLFLDRCSHPFCAPVHPTSVTVTTSAPPAPSLIISQRGAALLTGSNTDEPQKKGGGGEAELEYFVPSRQLNGFLPLPLLSEYIFWRLHDGTKSREGLSLTHTVPDTPLVCVCALSALSQCHSLTALLLCHCVCVCVLLQERVWLGEGRLVVARRMSATAASRTMPRRVAGIAAVMEATAATGAVTAWMSYRFL